MAKHIPGGRPVRKTVKLSLDEEHAIEAVACARDIKFSEALRYLVSLGLSIQHNGDLHEVKKNGRNS